MTRARAADTSSDFNPLALPEVGSFHLRLLAPQVLEIEYINTKAPDPARVQQWDFVIGDFKLRLPAKDQIKVLVDGKPAAVERIGFKRRVLYAPLKKRDLRIGNYLYVELTKPITDDQTVQIQNPDGRLWPQTVSLQCKADPLRWSPAIHVNQTGYQPEFSKKAMVGYYLGSLGELKPGTQNQPPKFQLIETAGSKAVFEGQMKRRPDVGFTFPCYQEVWEADFSAFKTPGEYRIRVPGIGASFPFFIDEGVAAAFARTYALGLYHQRCGQDNRLPFTRFVHGPCHTALAKIPFPPDVFKPTQQLIEGSSSEGGKDPNETSPQLKNVQTSLYPFVRHGEVDVSGGHHDAGDYSKYTINSAALIHYLIFAADAFPGAGELDNLGIPESGDGKSDLLQEAKWEADFLAKMQDDDGGFYFLVYPEDRRYEDDVLPDKGDRQVVWPKTTSVTAVAVAALAQASSSPLFRKQFPEAAKTYFEKAQKGWAFLERAIARYGKKGSYQHITHYGHEFLHDDELAWAAAEMFLATGDKAFENKLIAAFDPTDRETKRWTWWRLYEGYGCAIRSYAFGARTGRVKADRLNNEFLAKCRSEIMAAGEDQTRFASESAYGTSFPDPTKRFRSAGWYFSTERAFDIAVAWQLDEASQSPRRSDFDEALLSNMNYEGGCNPVNRSYLTGLGWTRQRDVVHQYAQNDRRLLPPSGIPIGNVQGGFQFLDNYGKELGTLSFPPDGAEDAPYPFYDRWGDSFNTTTEFVAVDQARSLGTLAFLMARTSLKTQPWKPVQGQIQKADGAVKTGNAVSFSLQAPGLDLSKARVIWEGEGQEPVFGKTFQMAPKKESPRWIECEAQLPDGRRVFGVLDRDQER